MSLIEKLFAREDALWCFHESQQQVEFAGGQVDDFKSTDNVVEYNPASNSWSTIGTLPVPLQGPVVVQYGDTIIVTTGNKGQGPTTTTYIGKLG